MTNITKEQEAEFNELIDILKFTPRTYKIQVYGYGGDSRFLRATREQYLYFKENDIDIEDYASSWDNEHEVPEEFQPFPPGEPYDGDEIFYAGGANFDDGGYVQITDEQDQVVLETTLDSLDDHEIEYDEDEDWYPGNTNPPGSVLIWHGNGEKGTFYGGEIELTTPFNPKKLRFEYTDCDGASYLTTIYYDGEEIDNNDYSTTGKWTETRWVVVGGEDKIDTTGASLKVRVEHAKKSPWFPVKTKPWEAGLYECKFKLDKKAAWPWLSDELVEWDGKKWLTEKKVNEWRGLAQKMEE